MGGCPMVEGRTSTWEGWSVGLCNSDETLCGLLSAVAKLNVALSSKRDRGIAELINRMAIQCQVS